jgi:hypothetical protein
LLLVTTYGEIAMRRVGLLAAAAMVLGALAISSAHANLVTNGGFETGSFSGWIQGGNTGNTFVGASPNSPYAGSYAAQLGPVGSNGTLTQGLATSAGQTYEISYWLIGDGSPNYFSVSWNGTLLEQTFDWSLRVWTQFTFDVVAVGSDILEFAFRNDPAYLGLDNISVDPVGAVPEPAGMALLGAGLAGLALIRRRSQGA